MIDKNEGRREYDANENPYRRKIQKCVHDYEEVYSDMDGESYKCLKCGDRYKLYYDDMR